MEGDSSLPTKSKSTRLRTLIKEKWAALGHQRSHLKLVSPVPHLHLSNNAPSDEEEILIRQALEDVERQRQEIRADMERRAIWELVERKSQAPPPELEYVHGYMRSLQSVLSPIRRLPPEILQAIFLVGSEGPDMRTPFLELRRNPQKYRVVGAVYWPWTLSKVCHQWRQTCIGTPSLWNYLPTMYLCPPDYAEERIWDNQVFALMIERSRGTPLSVYINGTRRLPSTHHTLEMLVKESNRWEELILETTWSTYQEYINPIRNRMQQLRRLRFYFLDDDQRTVPITWDAFSDSPCLQHIDLQLTIRGQTFIGPPSPFITSAVHTFMNNVNLQSTSLAIPLNVVPSFSIILPHLKRLKLLYARSDPPIMLDALTLPALEELIVEIHAPVDGQQMIPPFIRSLIERSVAAAKDAFPLNKLCMKRFPIVESDFLAALIDLLPNLRALEVPLSNHSWGIMHRLASTSPGMIIAPNLEFCTFHHETVISPSWYNALNLVAKVRCGASLPTNGRPSSTPSSTPTGGLAEEMDITDVVPFKRLKVLALHCHNFMNLEILKYNQRILEEFSLCQRSNLDSLSIAPSTLGNLAYWFKVLEAHGVGIDFRLDLGHETRSLSQETATAILKELRGCNLDNVDVKDIYIPHFHLQLQALDHYIDVNGHKVKWRGAPIVLKQLQSALREAIEKCYLVLDAHIFEIHWVMVNRRLLMYVPPNHPIRSSSESIKLARGYERSSNLSPFYEMFCEGTSLDDWED